MFFDSVDDIGKIATRNGCSVFVVPDDTDVTLPGAMMLQPEEKSTITIEQVRDVISLLSVKQLSDVFVLVRPADAMGEEAANAFLKNLEEPKDKVHFVLVTSNPSRLLSTVLSRSAVYFLRRNGNGNEIKADKKSMELAKKIIVAKPAELVDIANTIMKKKDGVRAYALSILSVAIEMLYKSYFITSKDIFVKKLPKFLACYEAIERNGHIKLHLVSDLI